MEPPVGNERTVASTVVGDVWVSTVRLTFDHGFHQDRPLWYETMVFPHKDGVEDWGELYCDRYETLDQALEGHQRIVTMCGAGKLDTLNFDQEDSNE